MNTLKKRISDLFMGESKFDKSTDLSDKSAVTALCRLCTTGMVQNFHLVWLDGKIDESNDDYRNSITELRQVVNTVNTFIDVDECIDFINSVEEERAFLISSGTLGRTAVPVMHDKPQVNTIYIFCSNQAQHEEWAKEWTKVAGVYTDIVPICTALKQATHDFDHNSISISFTRKGGAVGNENRDTLDCSFMYTQILKEILLTIDFEQIHIKNFLTFCRERFVGNPAELQNVDLMEKDYHRHKPTWWYTYDSFLYPMLNRALRLMDVDLIIKMGFFLRDLHNQIAALHHKQYAKSDQSHSFTLYRGQGLSETDFTQLKATQGGLLAFNNFLSTSPGREVPLEFARRTIDNSDLMGVLFVMTIDPLLSTTPFANIKQVSCYRREKEILFSMHAVFRVGLVQQIEQNERLWQVDLTLTGDNDSQLHRLTERMREETLSGYKGWLRLGQLLIQMGQFDKAEDLYSAMLQQATSEAQQEHLYHRLGLIKDNQGDYAAALEYYEKSIAIKQKTLPPTHADFAVSYNNIGMVYDNMGEYSKALSFLKQALEIEEKTVPANHPNLATSYTSIGSVYKNMGEYSKALSFLKQALEIEQKTLPANHPDLATSYSNIGSVYNNMGEYSEALSSHEQALKIEQKTLPANHPHVAASYSSIGSVYKNMGAYSKALSSLKQALKIQQKILRVNHPHLATSYNNIGSVYNNMGEYSEALSYYEQALEIRQKALPANHPDLATCYNNIGSVYMNMGEYSKALSSFKQALEIQQKTLPANHPHLATSYRNIGSVYNSTGEYSEAVSYYEQTLEIEQKNIAANHPDLATCYNNIASMHENMGEYSKALSDYKQALEIYQKTLPDNHPDVATTYNNIGAMYNNMGEHSKALFCYEQALDIRQRTVSANHPHLAISYSNIGSVYKNMGKYSKALSCHKQALKIRRKTLPDDHPDLATSYNNIGSVYKNMRKHFKALFCYERALGIYQRSLPLNHPDLKDVKESVDEILDRKL